MTVIVDANIIFSAILNPSRQISSILTRSLKNDIIFVSPNFLRQELFKHRPRLAKLTESSMDIVETVENFFCKKIHFYNEEIIPQEIWNHSDSLTQGIDIKDSVYIAFALFFSCPLWSGDNKLKDHLLSKGHNLILNTSEIIEQS